MARCQKLLSFLDTARELFNPILETVSFPLEFWTDYNPIADGLTECSALVILVIPNAIDTST